MIKLSLELSILINSELEKKGIYREYKINDDLFCIFEQPKLNLIESLTLENFDSLDGLEMLSGLKHLTIKSVPYQKIIYGNYETASKFRNNISDFRNIENLYKLENLNIENDININRLNIQKLQRLKKLHIINNPNLKEIKGIEDLYELQEVIIYGSNIQRFPNIIKYIKNSFTAEVNILDISVFLNMVLRDKDFAKQIEDLYVQGYTKLKFAEQTGFVDFVAFEPYLLRNTYEKVCEIIEQLKLQKLDMRANIKVIYDYVVNNVKFDVEGLKEREYLYNKYVVDGIIPNFAKRKFAMIHSSYSALKYKKSNCEGFVNLLIFMYKILGIESCNVHCSLNNHKIEHFPNHSIIKINYNGNWYYCDPTLEAQGFGKHFMLSKDEIMNTHMLNILEEVVGVVKIDEEKQYGRGIK